MFKNLSNSSKIGLAMQAIAGAIMGVLVLVDKPIPDFLAWIFFMGIIITIVPEIIKPKKL